MLYEGMLYEGTVPEVRKNTHVYNYSTRRPYNITAEVSYIYTKSCYLFLYSGFLFPYESTTTTRLLYEGTK
jgi:hypothetical protein